MRKKYLLSRPLIRSVLCSTPEKVLYGPYFLFNKKKKVFFIFVVRRNILTLEHVLEPFLNRTINQSEFQAMYCWLLGNQKYVELITSFNEKIYLLMILFED
jgi:hypothetical protein